MPSDLPTGWRRSTLDQLVALQRGYDLPERVRRPGDVPVVGSAGISGWHDDVRAPAPGIVIGRAGASMGVVTYCDRDFWPLNTALFVTDFLGNDPRFAFYLLKTLDFQGFNSGSVQPMLNRNFIRGIEIALPPVSEQRRISSVLASLDDKAASNLTLANALEAVVEAQFDRLFSGHRAAADRAAPLGKGWRIRELGAIASIAKKTMQPSATPTDLFEHYSIPAFDEGMAAEVVPGADMLSGKTELPAGEVVLLSKLNPAFKRIWWPRPEHVYPAVCSPEFLALVARAEVPTTYLCAVVQHDGAFYRELLGHASGTTGSRQRVKPADALACPVLVPPASVMKDWDQFARPLYDRAHAVRQEARTLKKIRNELLPRLVSGAQPVSGGPSDAQAETGDVLVAA